nr:MAG TPA: hypothetical protein [Caudoviricetes sp.]
MIPTRFHAFFMLFLHNPFLVNSTLSNYFPSTYLLPTFIPRISNNNLIHTV